MPLGKQKDLLFAAEDEIGMHNAVEYAEDSEAAGTRANADTVRGIEAWGNPGVGLSVWLASLTVGLFWKHSIGLKQETSPKSINGYN